MAATPYSTRIIADSPLAYWRLDETSGTVASDSVGTRHGTIESGVVLGVPGQTGSTAIQFGGAGGIALPSLTIPGICTIELWMRTTSVQQFNVVFTIRTSGLPTQHLIMLQDGQVQFKSSGPIAVYSPLINNGNWHHVIGISDGTNITIYVNTVQGQTTASVESAKTSSGKIANDDFSGFGVATIQDVAIYPRALTLTEIADHYSLGITPLVTGQAPYTQLIDPGPSVLLKQNIVYALPAAKCQLLSEQLVQISTTVGGTFADKVGSNVEPGVLVQGGFVKCALGDTNIIVKKHTRRH